MQNDCLLPKSINNIICQLENKNDVNSEFLINLIKQEDITIQDLFPFSKFNHPMIESYGRTKVYESARFSIFVMSWAPTDFTAIHSHGHSEWGAVLFLNNVNHRLYDYKENTLTLVQKGIVEKGSIVPVNGSLVHAMGNLTDQPFITLHIYGTNNSDGLTIQDSVVYELENKRRTTTNGAAYISLCTSHSKKIEDGIKTDEESLIDYLKIILPYYKKNNNAEMIYYIKEVLNNPKIYFEQN
ncbi:MAG: cysteine dioxygenase family protein [Bacteroidota bacterium]